MGVLWPYLSQTATIMDFECNYKAASGCILVMVPARQERMDGLIVNPFNDERPDRGIVIDPSDAMGVSEGDTVLFIKSSATLVDGDVWSVGIEDGLLATINPDQLVPLSGRRAT